MERSGVINIYKEAGYTSHDVVAKLRGILKQKKIGHTGTLDPQAQGVLPVCLGKGTKLCDLLAGIRGSASVGNHHRYPGYGRNDPEEVVSAGVGRRSPHLHSFVSG